MTPATFVQLRIEKNWLAIEMCDDSRTSSAGIEQPVESPPLAAAAQARGRRYGQPRARAIFGGCWVSVRSWGRFPMGHARHSLATNCEKCLPFGIAFRR